VTAATTVAPVDDGRCFACGLLSDYGLKMRFSTDDAREVACRIVLPPMVQGWRGLAHGGIVALLLDEAMAYAAGAHGHKGMTGEMKLRFRKSVPIGEPLLVRGKIVWQRRNVLGAEARVEDAEGTLLATATGSFVSVGLLEPGVTLGEPKLEESAGPDALTES
jgi:uncharacterized protein (TIGR00369 family)